MYNNNKTDRKVSRQLFLRQDFGIRLFSFIGLKDATALPHKAQPQIDSSYTEDLWHNINEPMRNNGG